MLRTPERTTIVVTEPVGRSQSWTGFPRHDTLSSAMASIGTDASRQALPPRRAGYLRRQTETSGSSVAETRVARATSASRRFSPRFCLDFFVATSILSCAEPRDRTLEPTTSSTTTGSPTTSNGTDVDSSGGTSTPESSTVTGNDSATTTGGDYPLACQVPCSTSFDCCDILNCDSSQYSCTDGSCRAIGCVVDEHCIEEYPDCVDIFGFGTCLQPCATDDDCQAQTPGYACGNAIVGVTDHCVPPPCVDNSDCLFSNAACNRGRCVSLPCTGDRDCNILQPVCLEESGTCGCNTATECRDGFECAPRAPW